MLGFAIVIPGIIVLILVILIIVHLVGESEPKGRSRRLPETSRPPGVWSEEGKFDQVWAKAKKVKSAVGGRTGRRAIHCDTTRSSPLARTRRRNHEDVDHHGLHRDWRRRGVDPPILRPSRGHQ